MRNRNKFEIIGLILLLTFMCITMAVWRPFTRQSQTSAAPVLWGILALNSADISRVVQQSSHSTATPTSDPAAGTPIASRNNSANTAPTTSTSVQTTTNEHSGSITQNLERIVVTTLCQDATRQLLAQHYQTAVSEETSRYQTTLSQLLPIDLRNLQQRELELHQQSLAHLRALYQTALTQAGC